MFEIQRSGDKTISGEIGLDIRTHASPKVGQDQVSGGVSVLCWHAAPVACVLWSKIEKVPRGIRGEKSSKTMASSRNLVSTIGALASPKMGDGTRCPEG